MHLVDESLKVGGSGSDNSMQWTFFMNPLPMTIWTKVLFQSSNSSFFWPNFSLLVLAQVSSCAWESCGGSGWWTSGLTPQTGGWVWGGNWQLKAPFSCWNISYQLLWFRCPTRILINFSSQLLGWDTKYYRGRGCVGSFFYKYSLVKLESTVQICSYAQIPYELPNNTRGAGVGVGSGGPHHEQQIQLFF